MRKEIANCFTRHGAQGQMDTASKSTLENEFGTQNDEEAIKQILEKGTLQESEVRIPLPSLPVPFHLVKIRY